MARVYMTQSQAIKMPSKQNGNLSDDEDGVHSGSATGFSDGEELAHARPARVVSHAFDPVNRILDKIDAELSSLTHSQGSSSTATDSTVVRRSPSHAESTDTSRLDCGSLTISQLGTSHKPTYSPLCSSSRHTVTSSDRDTGIGTGASSFRDSHHRSRSEQEPVRALEPGDDFKNAGLGPFPRRSNSPPRRSNSPDLAILHGHHGQSDDDKSKREQMTGSPFEAKQLDDKFKEIMQKRKGGVFGRASTDDDNQTIRTEDFADKFQDALIYPSSDEAERLRNIEEDLESDGGWDTDTIQRKLVSLTQTSPPHKYTDGRASPCPLPRPQRRLGPPPEIRPRKVGGPGTPPVYPKPTPTNTLPRPSTRSSIKFTPGHASDADSVKTEDFEHQFKDMMVNQGRQPVDSESDTVANDPIHAKVKELLKATAKYAGKPLAPVSNSILKSQLKSYTDKPKIEPKPKHHVRISARPPQYQEQNEGDDSDDTLCSEKDVRVTSPGTSNIEDFWEPIRKSNRELPNFRENNFRNQPLWTEPFQPRTSPPCSVTHGGQPQRKPLFTYPSFDESLSTSKSSTSLSQSSISSGDKNRSEERRLVLTNVLGYGLDTIPNTGEQFYSDRESSTSDASFSDGRISSEGGILVNYSCDRAVTDKSRKSSQRSLQAECYPSDHDPVLKKGPEYHRQVSQISSTSSAFSSTGSALSSDYTERSNSNHSYQATTSESYCDENSRSQRRGPLFKKEFKSPHLYTAGSRRRSHSIAAPYSPNLSVNNDSIMKKDKQTNKKQRDLIVQDDEEEYPFAKYTFNKKPNKGDDSSSSLSNSSRFSSSRDSIYSVSLLKQYNHMRNNRSITSRSSNTSLLSSFTSSVTESPESLDDLGSPGTMGQSAWRNKTFHSQKSSPLLIKPSNKFNWDRLGTQPGSVSHNDMFQYGSSSTSAVPTDTETMLKGFGLDEARSILPERFMKSWIDKVLFNQKKEIEQKRLLASQENHQLYLNSDQYYVDDTDFLPPSVSAQQSGASTPCWMSSLENLYSGPYTKDPRIGQRVGPRMKLRRSKTFNSSNSSFGLNFTNDKNESADPVYSNVVALSMTKENSFDRLKQMLQSSDPLVTYSDRDWKRHRFASHRQQSLPIFLETLSEEEEEKTHSRKNKLNFKKAGGNTSNMKHFFDEEEEHMKRSSSVSSTENVTPKNGVRSSPDVHQPTNGIIWGRDKTYHPVYHSISSSDDAAISEASEKCSSNNNSIKSYSTSTSEAELRGVTLTTQDLHSADSKMCLPSIFVSEKEIFRHETRVGHQSFNNISNHTCFQERPMSPNPDNQVHTNTEETILRSKDSLEVAEIMSPSYKIPFTPSSFNIPPHEKARPFVREPHIVQIKRTENRNSTGSSTSKFLSIEQDDKYLSPSSSTASPLIMSPITVIEVKKLDNQNDSLELEDNKDTDSSAATSLERHIQQCQNETQSKSPVGKSDNGMNMSQYQIPSRVKRSSGATDAPKELSLERRRYTRELKVDDDTESDDVFAEVSQLSNSLETNDACMQADNDGLAPLFKFSEVSKLIQEMCSKLQCKIGEGLVYMAHDKGVQCDFTEVNTSVMFENEKSTASELDSEDTSLRRNIYCQTHASNHKSPAWTMNTDTCSEILMKNDTETETKESYCQMSLNHEAKNCELNHNEIKSNHANEDPDGTLIPDKSELHFCEKTDQCKEEFAVSAKSDEVNMCHNKTGRFKTEVFLVVGTNASVNVKLNSNQNPVNKVFDGNQTEADYISGNVSNFTNCNTPNICTETVNQESLVSSDIGHTCVQCSLDTDLMEQRRNCDEKIFESQLDKMYKNGNERNAMVFHELEEIKDANYVEIRHSCQHKIQDRVQELKVSEFVEIRDSCNDIRVPDDVVERPLRQLCVNIETLTVPGSSITCNQSASELSQVEIDLKEAAEEREICSFVIQKGMGESNTSGNTLPKTAKAESLIYGQDIKMISLEDTCIESIPTKRNKHVLEMKTPSNKCERVIKNAHVNAKDAKCEFASDKLETVEEFRHEGNNGEVTVNDRYVEGQLKSSKTMECSKDTFCSTKEIVLCLSDMKHKLSDRNCADSLGSQKSSETGKTGIQIAVKQDDTSSKEIRIKEHNTRKKEIAEFHHPSNLDSWFSKCDKDNAIKNKISEETNSNILETNMSHTSSVERNSQLSSRSLDFDTLGTRKSILMRSHGTMFSKSFGGDFALTVDEGEIENSLKDLTSAVFRDNQYSLDGSTSTGKTLKGLVKDVLKLNSKSKHIENKTPDVVGTHRVMNKSVKERDLLDIQLLKSVSKDSETGDEWMKCEPTIDKKVVDRRDNAESLCIQFDFSDDLVNQNTVDFDGKVNEMDIDGSGKSLNDLSNDATDFERECVYVNDDGLSVCNIKMDLESGKQTCDISTDIKIPNTSEQNGEIYCDMFDTRTEKELAMIHERKQDNKYFQTANKSKQLTKTKEGQVNENEQLTKTKEDQVNKHEQPTKTEENQINKREQLTKTKEVQGPDTEDIIHNDYTHSDDNSDFNNALEELDKLYRLALDNHKLHDDMSISESNDFKTSGDQGGVKQFLEELDHELDKMEIYSMKLKNVQVHFCKNCGHSAEYEVMDYDLSEMGEVEHDYCSHCSPLKLSTDVLERHRLNRKLN